MENKINIAKILKDCPKGMELNCTMYENVEFDYIEQNSELTYPIHCLMKINGGYNALVFTRNGCNDRHPNAKCVIFPKGKTTWEGFTPPCNFKDGDIVSTMNGIWIGIVKRLVSGACETYVTIYNDSLVYNENIYYFERLATEKEKEKLFKTIKDNGYKWNPETKTLEKLVKPKFKVGNKIKYINGKNKDGVKEGIILSITDDTYDVAVTNDMGIFVPIAEQDNWELVPDKFDISSLNPFESRVLVRNSNSGFWQPTFWGIYKAEKANEHHYRNYLTTKGFFRHCIPYNDDTKHLLGTTNDCDEYYKTWE